MLKIIGIILLLYGAAGIIATVLVYGALRGPLQHARELLRFLARKIAIGGEASRRASSWVSQAVPVFDQIGAVLAKIAGAFKQAASRFGEAAGIVKSVESTLDGVQFPVLTPKMKTLDLSFSAEAVSGVNLTEYSVSGVPFKLYGPPLSLDTTSIGFDLGELPVLTGITIEPIYPLVPVGDVFHLAGDKIEAAQERIGEAADLIVAVKERTLEAKEKAEKMSESIKDLGDKLEEASKDLTALSQSKLFGLIPALVLAYFGLIHFAFALTGLALFSL